MALRITTRPGHTDGTIQALKSIMRPAMIERGCLRCDLSIDTESRHTLIYSEEWASEESLTRQILSDRFVRVLMLMETASRPPELDFAFVSETRGLEFVEAVLREGKGS